MRTPTLLAICLSTWIAVAAPGNAQHRPDPVLTGIDVLQRDGFAVLDGAKVGVITNHTGVNREGESVVTLLHEAKNVDLIAIFSPEHGFAGRLDQSRIADAQDAATGLPIYSLYGETRRPTAESLDGIDTLVFDIQDIGCRFYTYISTMGNAMQEAAKQGLRFVVLDRPNPIGGVTVQGPVLDAGLESFVGFHPIPIRHGMTTGELAKLFNTELQLELNLTVVRCEGWERSEFYDATNLRWINPSPNMRSLTQAFLYPGVGILETTNLSVGRGTDTPFEVLGAPFIEELTFAAALNGQNLPGVSFVPIRFTPDSSKYADEECGGVNILITDRATFDPLATGWTLATVLRQLYPDQWETRYLNRLLADERVFEAIKSGVQVEELKSLYADELQRFLPRRKPHLLY